ncbi:MAG: YfcE family phosphodiesterase [Clostridiales bacterium]|nr:YfcE family phosphodiesterase [Clostridiales bacterium]
MVYAVRATMPDLIFHLGDCWADAGQLQRRFSRIPMERVPGNCDYVQEFPERVIMVEGKQILICHGHTFGVKMGYSQLEQAAHERGADVALFGHTHRVFYGTHNGVTYLNPGSIGAPGYGIPPSYGILEIDGPTGYVHYDVMFLE